MADEIAQVVELEYKGIYYLLKGTKAMIAAMITGIKNLNEWNHKKWLEKPGSCSWQKIQEASNGMPSILEFPKEMFELTIDASKDPSIEGNGLITPFEYYCRKNGLRYCIMPDLNPHDDYIPVAVLAQDFGIHDEQIKSYMRKRVESEEAEDKSYDEKIEDAKNRLLNATTEEEKEEIEREIEALEEAKTQNGELLAESKEKMEKNNVLEFAEYIKQAEGTEFMNNPEVCLMQAQTCGVVKEFMPEDCMYPIRDAGLVPESKELFYSQKTGDDGLLTVKRSFEVDEAGLVYSVYEVRDEKTGQTCESVSDKGLSFEDWNKELPKVLREAGMMKDQPLTVVRSEEGLKEYILGLDVNFTNAQDGQEISSEAKIVIDSARKDAEQASAYARSFYSTIEVPSEQVMPNENMILSLELDDGLVEGVSLVGMDNQSAKLSIRSDAKYSFVGLDGKEKTMTGDEILKAIVGKTEGKTAVMAETKGAHR